MEPIERMLDPWCFRRPMGRHTDDRASVRFLRDMSRHGEQMFAKVLRGEEITPVEQNMHNASQLSLALSIELGATVGRRDQVLAEQGPAATKATWYMTGAWLLRNGAHFEPFDDLRRRDIAYLLQTGARFNDSLGWHIRWLAEFEEARYLHKCMLCRPRDASGAVGDRDEQVDVWFPRNSGDQFPGAPFPEFVLHCMQTWSNRGKKVPRWTLEIHDKLKLIRQFMAELDVSEIEKKTIKLADDDGPPDNPFGAKLTEQLHELAKSGLVLIQRKTKERRGTTKLIGHKFRFPFAAKHLIGTVQSTESDLSGDCLVDMKLRRNQKAILVALSKSTDEERAVASADLQAVDPHDPLKYLDSEHPAQFAVGRRWQAVSTHGEPRPMLAASAPTDVEMTEWVRRVAFPRADQERRERAEEAAARAPEPRRADKPLARKKRRKKARRSAVAVEPEPLAEYQEGVNQYGKRGRR